MTKYPLLLLAVCLLAAGCEQGKKIPVAEQETLSKVVTTYEEAVAKLNETTSQIQKGFESGDVDSAHEPLHSVGQTLDQLVTMARKKGFSSKQMESLRAAKTAMIDAFNELDKTLHGGEGKSFEEVRSAIDSSLKLISGLTPFSDVVDQLVDQTKKINDGFGAGDIDAAHGPLHDVGHTLEKLVGSADGLGFSDQQMTTLTQAKDEMFDAFNELDKTLHGGEGKTFDEVSPTINTSLEIISNLAASISKSSESSEFGEPDDHGSESEGDPDEGHGNEGEESDSHDH